MMTNVTFNNQAERSEYNGPKTQYKHTAKEIMMT